MYSLLIWKRPYLDDKLHKHSEYAGSIQEHYSTTSMSGSTTDEALEEFSAQSVIASGVQRPSRLPDSILRRFERYKSTWELRTLLGPLDWGDSFRLRLPSSVHRYGTGWLGVWECVRVLDLVRRVGICSESACSLFLFLSFSLCSSSSILWPQAPASLLALPKRSQVSHNSVSCR